MRYTAHHMLGLLAAAKRLQEEKGLSIHRAAERLGIAHSLFVKWMKQQSAKIDHILAMLKSKRKGTCVSPLGQLKPLKNTLLNHILKQHEQRITVNIFGIIVKASTLSPEFNAKHFIAKCSAVKQFVRAHLLIYQMGTRKCLHKPNKVVREATDYINLIHPLVEGPHHDLCFINNMNQSWSLSR
jgi:hypothetical protein